MTRLLALLAATLIAASNVAAAGDVPASKLAIAKSASAVNWAFHTPRGTATGSDLILHVKSRVLADSAFSYSAANAIASRLITGNMETMTPAQRSLIPWVLFTTLGPQEVQCIAFNHATNSIVATPVPAPPPAYVITRTGFESGCGQ